jgi:hypothetical protein
MKTGIVAATLVAGILVLTPQSGRACSCGRPPPPPIALGEADAVFTGIVLGIVPVVDKPVLAVLFYVKGAWKGIRSARVTIYTSASEASCGFPFRVYTEYIVYARRSVLVCCGLQTVTDMCSRTKVVWRAQEDFETLGEPRSVPLEDSTWGRIKTLYE